MQKYIFLFDQRAQLNDSNNFAVRLIELVISPSFDACKSLDDEARREVEDGLVNLITRSYRKSVSRGIVGRDGAPQTQWRNGFPALSFLYGLVLLSYQPSFAHFKITAPLGSASLPLYHTIYTIYILPFFLVALPFSSLIVYQICRINSALIVK